MQFLLAGDVIIYIEISRVSNEKKKPLRIREFCEVTR